MNRHPIDLTLSNSLIDLAARIRAEHEAQVVATRRSLGHALAAGDLLIEARAQLQHGQWGAWLAEHCDIADRTARLYMRLARNRPTIEKSASVAELTLRGAVAMLAEQTVEPSAPSNAAALAELDACEARIAKALHDLAMRGRYLAAIRDDKLYQSQWETFEQYCEERWELKPIEQRFLAHINVSKTK